MSAEPDNEAVTDRLARCAPGIGEPVIGRLELVAAIDEVVPAGLAISALGRIFLSSVRRDAGMPFTVAELRDGRLHPYPDAAMNTYDQTVPAERRLVSVYTVAVDRTRDRLWIVDSGSVARGPIVPGGAMTVGSDGLAIDPVERRLIYTPIEGRGLFSVALDAVADETLGDEAVAATVRIHPQRDFCSDGLAGDDKGNIYLTDIEHNAVRRRTPGGEYWIIARDPRLIWPDTLEVGPDGTVYVVVSQNNRQAAYHRRGDWRQPPYPIFRIRTG